MKIVLRENVENLGRRGDIVEVASGYGRNFLIPKKLAYLDTPGFRKMLAAERRAKEARELREQHEAQAVAGRIAEMSLSIPKKVGEEGHLYGSVTAQEISDLLAAHGIEIDRRRIVLTEPIRTMGTHTVPVRLHREVTAQVTLEVVAEK
ncbi:MAG: 50S ribosomal protein L9 [Acidobacteria bacterium]|nr:MAG: 50S ribosomal protein L9 [Acidobacteriota bacterium]